MTVNSLDEMPFENIVSKGKKLMQVTSIYSFHHNIFPPCQRTYLCPHTIFNDPGRECDLKYSGKIRKC